MSQPETLPYVPRCSHRDKRIFPDPACVEPEYQPHDQGHGNEGSQERIVLQCPNNRNTCLLESCAHWRCHTSFLERHCFHPARIFAAEDSVARLRDCASNFSLRL